MDKQCLNALRVSHILNVADDVMCYFPNDFQYLHREIVDGGFDDSIVEVFSEAADFVREARDAHGCALVHCYAGVNRSATVAMAVLMQIEDWTLAEAWRHV